MLALLEDFESSWDSRSLLEVLGSSGLLRVSRMVGMGGVESRRMAVVPIPVETAKIQ